MDQLADPDEKQMIGSILDDEDESPPQIKTPTKFPLTYSIKVQPKDDHNQYFQHNQRVYSPQLQHKTNSYDLDLKLHKVQAQYSAPNSSLKAKSLDQLGQFIATDGDDINLDGDLIAKCKDQNGARLIQKLFYSGTQEQQELIFSKLEKGILSLSKDVFGNYVVQNLMENGTHSQITKIVSILMPHMGQLAFHNYGCRVVQKSLTMAQESKKEFAIIFDQLKHKVKDLVIDQHGNHVVQKIIQLNGDNMSDWVIEGVEGQVQKLSNNSFGCRIIQKVITISKHDKLHKIFEEVMQQAVELCTSQYGNYIIQQLLKDGPIKIKKEIQNIIVERFEEFSFNKFGSNVVDKAIQYSDRDFKRKIIGQMIESNNEQVLFVRLSTNAYGNYVVQNFFKQVDYELWRELYLKIKNDHKLLYEIQKSQFGQHVYQMLMNKQELETFKL